MEVKMVVGKILPGTLLLVFLPTLQLLTVSFCSTAYSIKLFRHLSPRCFLCHNRSISRTRIDQYVTYTTAQIPLSVSSSTT